MENKPLYTQAFTCLRPFRISTAIALSLALALGTAFATSHHVRASVILSDWQADWPTEPDFTTGINPSNTFGTRSLGADRHNAQTITLAAGDFLHIGSMYLHYQSSSLIEAGSAFSVRIFEVSDPVATNLPNPSTNILDPVTVTMDHTQAPSEGFHTLRLDFTGDDQVILGHASEERYYAIQFANVAGTSPFGWRHRSGNDYTGGSAYWDSITGPKVGADNSLAIVAVPEPASFGLLISCFAGLLLLRRRRKGVTV